MLDHKEKVGFYSVGINLLLVGIKGILAYFSGSMALLADAIHSSTDVISSVTVLAGIKISKRKAKNFPYGLYKVENVVSLVTSIFIFFAGYEIIKTVFFKPIVLKSEYLFYAMAGVIVTMGITFVFSRYELRQGLVTGSPSLIADAKHIRTDMLSSAVILSGLLGGCFGLNLDRIAAVIVMVIVLKAGFEIFVDAFRVLLDVSLDFETMDRVKTIILQNPGVISINGLWGRNSGQYKFIEADIVIKAKNLEKAYAVSRRIENEIKAQVSHVDHILIHYMPRKKSTYVVTVPLNEDQQTLSEHFGGAPCFYLASIRIKDNAALSETFNRNPYAGEEKGKGIKVSEWLLGKGVDKVYTPNGFEGKGPGYVFSDADVEVIVAEKQSLDEIRASFFNIVDR